MDVQFSLALLKVLSQEASKDHRVFQPVKTLAKQLLSDSTKDNLAFTSSDLLGHVRQQSTQGPEAFATVISLVDTCLRFDLEDHARAFLDITCQFILQELEPDKTIRKYKNLMNACGECFLQPAINILRTYSQGPKTLQVAELGKFRKLLQRYLRHHVTLKTANPPDRDELKGWVHPPLNCGKSRCLACKELGAFLQADQETWICSVSKFHKHVQAQLPARLYLSQIKPRKHSLLGAMSEVLHVEKLRPGFEDASRQYKKEVKKQNERLRPYRQDYVRDMLGDEVYRELVLRETVTPKATKRTVQAGPRESEALAPAIKSTARPSVVPAPARVSPPAARAAKSGAEVSAPTTAVAKRPAEAVSEEDPVRKWARTHYKGRTRPGISSTGELITITNPK